MEMKYRHQLGESSRSSTGYPGVYYKQVGEGYRVSISYKSKEYHLGYYDDLEDAVAARTRGEQIVDDLALSPDEKAARLRSLPKTGRKDAQRRLIQDLAEFYGYELAFTPNGSVNMVSQEETRLSYPSMTDCLRDWVETMKATNHDQLDADGCSVWTHEELSLARGYRRKADDNSPLFKSGS